MSEIISGIKLVKWPDGKVCKHPSDFFKRNYLSRVGTMTNEEVCIDPTSMKLWAQIALEFLPVRSPPELNLWQRLT
ncbi:MAG: hypothetical protein ACI88H_001386 [Cocleimonas sp.]|jgi:hypothetical protein